MVKIVNPVRAQKFKWVLSIISRKAKFLRSTFLLPKSKRSYHKTKHYWSLFDFKKKKKKKGKSDNPPLCQLSGNPKSQLSLTDDFHKLIQLWVSLPRVTVQPACQKISQINAYH